MFAPSWKFQKTKDLAQLCIEALVKEQWVFTFFWGPSRAEIHE